MRLGDAVRKALGIARSAYGLATAVGDWPDEWAAPSRFSRVVVLGSKGFPNVAAAGGVERVVEQLTCRLATFGVTSLVYERAPVAGWRIQGRTLIRQIPFIDRKNQAFWSHSLLCALDYLQRRRPDDVIHIHAIQNAFLCPIFASLGHRVVFHLHGQEWRAQKWGPGMARFMRASILPMLQYSDAVVTVCGQSQQLLSARFPRAAAKIIHIPNGLPHHEPPPAATQRALLGNFGVSPRKFFLYAGRLVRHKRIEVAIQALRASGSDCPLLIAGSCSHSPDYVQELEAEISRASLAHQVRFVGQLSWDELLCLYLSCRALLHPSDSEGCSMTLLEATAAGTCIVCSDLGENRAVLGEAGLYCAVGDVDHLARLIRALGCDVMLADQRGRVAARQEALASWDELALRFLRLYWPDGTSETAYRHYGSSAEHPDQPQLPLLPL